MENTQLLDGKTLTYEYEELGTVQLDFNHGLLQFEWTKGPYTGLKGKDHPYQAKPVAQDVYLLNWLEQSDSSSITLIINLGEKEVHSSGLISPKSDQEMVLFHSAQIVSTSID